MLYRSTDRLCRCGAPMQNLAHSASFHSREKSAPSKPGTKQLGYPFFIAHVIVSSSNGTLFRTATLFEACQAAVGLTLFVSGLFALFGPAVAAIRLRRLWRLLAFMPLLPVYYGLVSLAAWRGLTELLLDPFRWNKTEHGLARTSRAGLVRDAGSTLGRPAQAAGRA